MKRKQLLYVVFVTLVFSCKNEKYPYNTNKKEFCEMLAEMYEGDIKYRTILHDPFFEILDSIKTVEGLQETYSRLPEEEQLSYGKIARAIANKRAKKFTEKEEDSIMQLQISLDNSNTEKLIKITQEFGWPTKNNTGCTEYFAPALIFRHAQPQYHKAISTLIDKALKEGKMVRGDYTFILNHLNGREDYEKTQEKVEKTINSNEGLKINIDF